MAKTPQVKTRTVKKQKPKYGPAFKLDRSVLWLAGAVLLGSALIAALTQVDLKAPPSFSSFSFSSVKDGKAGKAPSREEVSSAPSWKLVDIQGKGKGLVATSNIQPGDRIMVDYPLVTLPAVSNRTTVGQELLRRLNLLPEADKNEYFTLASNPSKLPKGGSGARVTEDVMALNIFESNAVRAGNDSAVYKNACRINHSCLPNANYFHRADLGALVVQAVKFIARGEEIVAPYFNAVLHTREERQEYLHKVYHFDCKCAACSMGTADVEASDRRRARISDLMEVVEGWGRRRTVGPGEALAAVEEAVDLYEKEDYHASLGSWHVNALAISAAHQDAASVKKWALKAAVRYAIETGQDSPELRSISAVYENPEVAQAWGTRDARVF